MDEHHKMQRFLQKNDSKNIVLVSTESISDLPIFKLSDTEAVLEPKLVISVRPSHSSVAPRLLVSGKLIHEHLWGRRTGPLLVRRGAEIARRADRGEAHEQFT